MEHCVEPGRQLQVVDHCDVVVAGAGPAGVAAALAAAEAGARVTLLERAGQLGGIWTSGLLGWILDSSNKPGIMQRIVTRLQAIGGCQPPTFGGIACDIEKLKLLLEEMCGEHKVRVRLHTHVASALVDDSQRMRVAITESKSGREAWAAKTFVDCTGDGDLAAQAGCSFDMGHPTTGLTQPMSLILLIGGVQYDRIKPYVYGDGQRHRESTARILDRLKTMGVDPSYAAPSIFRVYDDLFLVMTNHVYKASAISSDDITRATLESRREIHQIIDALRRSGGEWADVKIVATASQVGVREGRRIRGRYAVTRDDLVAGRTFEDAICRVTFPVDVHALDPATSKGFDRPKERAQPYDLPMRALISADIDNLLMAGRCISGDFLAHSSYRVTGNAVAMGQAAGVCAALAARSGRPAHEIPFTDIKRHLEEINTSAPGGAETDYRKIYSL